MLEFLSILVRPLKRLGGAPFMERTLELGVGSSRIVDVRLGRSVTSSDKGAQFFSNLDHCSSFRFEW
jgi:hypothetical protein